MARVRGQVDESKTEAILEAAQALFSEQGGGVSMDAIARRAGVSRQTLYNRFPNKLEIGRALAARRSDAISAPLRAGGEGIDPARPILTYGNSAAISQRSEALCSVIGPGFILRLRLRLG